MLIHPQIDPVALQIGPLAIHWYGLTYLAAFGLFLWLGLRRLRHEPFAFITGPGAWRRADVEDILFLGVMGVVIGGRLGYCLFYKPGYYATHPQEIFAVWQGGMSFHGGMLGVMAAMAWFARSRHRSFLQVMDFVAPCIPTGLAAGRVGNFINGELWGRIADPSLPWAMVFRGAGSTPRHPSQIYQFLMEGLLLFVLLWLYARKERAPGQVSVRLPVRVWRVPFHRRVLPRTRCPPGPAGAGHEHGPVAVCAHDSGWRRPVVVVRAARAGRGRPFRLKFEENLPDPGVDWSFIAIKFDFSSGRG
jgi:phosphatidylglycerol:prolipoprotein diacylglycerol transferase